MSSASYRLHALHLYNWGAFAGRHQASISPDNSAIIGPTGSGKTTLIDALMTLLCQHPRYNLASTGGHESDRDLVSYLRGASGPGCTGRHALMHCFSFSRNLMVSLSYYMLCEYATPWAPTARSFNYALSARARYSGGAGP